MSIIWKGSTDARATTYRCVATTRRHLKLGPVGPRQWTTADALPDEIQLCLDQVMNTPALVTHYHYEASSTILTCLRPSIVTIY